MKTLDLKKEFKYLYQPSAKKIEIVKVPRLQFAMIDGAIEKGSEPGKSSAFQEATQAIYGIAYTLKFMLKKRKTNAVDYPVMALEGLWWVEDGVFDITIKDNWFYTLMIMQPSVITKDLFEEACEQVRKKKGDSPALEKLRLDYFEEGLCAQVMHIGPYATEPATIELMKEFMQANGYRDNVGPNGKHHEIYLGDPHQIKISSGGPEVDVFIPKDIWDNLSTEQRAFIQQRLDVFNVNNDPKFTIDFYQDIPLDKVPSGWPNPRINIPPGSIIFNPDGTIIHEPFAKP